jgi:hypothetical protein
MEEVEEGFSELYYREGNNIWRYALHTKDKQVKNLTVLFRGGPDEILSHVKYGALLVNEKVIDVLKHVDEDDPRVQGFDIVLPSTKDLDVNLVLSFTHHEYAETKVRILADVGEPEEGNVATAVGAIIEGRVHGDLWTNTWSPKKVDFQEEINTIVSRVDMRQMKLDFEERQVK